MFSSSGRQAAAQAAREAERSITYHDIAAYRALLDAIGTLVAAQGNALSADTERAVRERVVFHAAAEDAHIDCARETETATALATT